MLEFIDKDHPARIVSRPIGITYSELFLNIATAYAVPSEFAFCAQEMSYKCGLKYIVAIVAEFDEYSNDVLHAREGSCLPR